MPPPLRVLVTGFEPFGGSAVNPSQQLIERLGADGVPGLDIATALLPVSGRAAASTLREALARTTPGAVVCLGEDGRRGTIAIERVALNLRDYRLPDNDGTIIEDQPVIADGPAARFATLPVRAIRDAINAADVPVQLSLSAGAFLCNEMLYVLLDELERTGNGAIGGFIHVPRLPEQCGPRDTDAPGAGAPDARAPSMPLETSLRGVTAALSVLVDS